jgi:beta-lactam-binding protein with PASTA domain
VSVTVRGSFSGGSGAGNIRINLTVSQESQTTTSVTVRYVLTIERTSGTGFFNLGLSNSSFITTGTPTGITTNNFQYDFRTSPFIYTIRSATRTINTTTPQTISFSATATDNSSGIGTATTSTGSLTIQPTVSSGTVPNVLGLTGGDANFVISNSGFNPNFLGGTSSGATAANNGTVASQSPAGGTTATLGTNVSYTTYSYTPPSTYTVPNVISDPNTTAVTRLLNAGAGSVSQSFTTVGATSVNNRRVLSQSPAGGTTATVGNTVSITSYDFLLEVPNILGLTQSAANSALDAAGFLTRSSSLTTTGATVANNLLVATQNPTGGTQYNPIDNVAYVLFNFLTAVPNVVGQLQDTAFTNLGNLGFTSVTVTLDEVGATTANVGTVKSQNPVNSSTTYNPANTSVSLVVYSLGVTGKRYTGTGFTALTNAKRYDGTSWVQMTVQKRFDGTVWRDISN